MILQTRPSPETGQNPAFLPLDLRLVVFDHTVYYREDIQAEAGKIFQVYVYDANRVTNCCEIRPSYELYPLLTQPLNCPESERERDALDELVGQDTDERYIHCSVIDAIPALRQRPYEVIERDLSETYEAQFESAIEKMRGNPPCVMPGRSDCILV